MPNSSSSKYVKRRAHRRTKSRRHAKKYTIKKVMRGCNSKQYGGAQPLGNTPVSGSTTELPVGRSSPGQIATLKEGADSHLKLTQLANTTKSEPLTETVTLNIAPQKGGYKSKHRRRRYKKSIGRKGRSRRFRGSRK